MNYSRFAAAFAALAFSACGQQQRADTNSQSAQATETYSGTGEVTAVAGDQVTIAHGPIQGIGWPAMTMTFIAPAGMASAAKAGDEVSFSFQQAGSAYQLTSLQKR
jgi:Cu(I)/Ag(I) efflux system protein CusF